MSKKIMNEPKQWAVLRWLSGNTHAEFLAFVTAHGSQAAWLRAKDEGVHDGKDNHVFCRPAWEGAAQHYRTVPGLEDHT